MPAPPRILLVEDDTEQAALFKTALTMRGYEVVLATTAEEALKHLSISSFALLLSDWDLPGINGDELIAQVKAQAPHIKAILFSNHSHVDQVCDECGADAWFRKIEGIPSLRRVVAELLPLNAQQD